MLGQLRQEHSFHRLPKDPRTFLSTPRKSVIRKVDPGCYCHIGIQKSLQQQYQILQETPTDIIEIGINIDGLPLTKSSSSQFYPILGVVKKMFVDLSEDDEKNVPECPIIQTINPVMLND
ncbi:hypothetical protein QE152_g38061 [Popillia japonica]|uniref:Uncharacterized protein n=1 Tax=Popillia japonica TaxID=7064 RepID=A0AAW1I8Z8_POPJA